MFDGTYTDKGRPHYKLMPMTKFNESLVGELCNGVPVMQVPCGKCLGCRLDYSKDWANRCMLEARQYPADMNHFITLTYDDDHVPKNDQGSAYTLKKDDLRTFMKDLRSKVEYDTGHIGIRFFGCGEYGSETFRPHYHLILFNLRLDDLQPFRRSSQGYMYYRSEFIEKIWHKGNVLVADCSWQTCAYVARYVMKKASYEHQRTNAYAEFGIEREFVLMSRRPGIGRKYYEDHKGEIYAYDKQFLGSPDGSIEIRPPKYFDRLYTEDDPEHMEAIKENRRYFAQGSVLQAESQSTKDYLEILSDKDITLRNKTKILGKRGVSNA